MSTDIKGESEMKKEDWMNAKWRPMMGWMYMLVCTCDFVVFPVLWSIANTINGGAVGVQWNPITLQGAGLFHMAMGAIIGVAAFGRTQEKLAGAAQNIPVGAPTHEVPVPTSAAPVVTPTPAAPESVPAPVLISSTGKPMPPPQVDPLI